MALAVKDPLASTGDVRDVGLIPGLGKSPEGGHGARQPAPIFLPGKPHGQVSLVGYGPWDDTELDMTEATGKSHQQRSLAGYSPWGHTELDTTEVT